MPLRNAVLSLLGWCLLNGTLMAAPSAWRTDFDSARIEAQKTQRPLLVHFYSDSCAPCVQMEQNVLHKAPIEEYIQGNLVAVSVNVDQHSDLQKRFNVNRWPCDYVLDPSGTRRLVTSVGPRSLADYHQMLAKSVEWNAQLQARLPQPPPEDVVSHQTPAPVQASKKYSPEKLLLDGFSPVSLLNDKKWIKGTEEFAVDYEGQWFFLTNADEVKAFRVKPEDYVPQFMAVLAISREPEKYGFDAIQLDEPIAFDEIALRGTVDLRAIARFAECTYEEMRLLNPAVLKHSTPGKDGVTMLRVPRGKADIILE